ncbi:hypothetical protein HER39_14830, partial [Arthrobacter deserti]|nr:hypothetical protein [Arthrobacter deserti]
AALVINTAVYIACAYFLPHGEAEQSRLAQLWRTAKEGAGEDRVPETSNV